LRSRVDWLQGKRRCGSGWLNGLAARGARPSAEARLARKTQKLEDSLVIEPLKKTALIRVVYASRDPELSARVLRTLATLYQEKHAAVHRPTGTFGFFDQQASRYEAELVAGEARLANFDNREDVVAPAAQKQMILEQLGQFETQWQQDRAGAYGAERRALALEQQAARAPERQTTQTMKTDNGELLAQLQSTLLSLELKHSEMLAKYEPDYPLVKELEAEIADARKAIGQAEQSPVEEVTTDRAPVQDWLATELAKAETDRAQFEAEATATARTVRDYREAAQQLDRKERMQDDLVRGVKTAENNYLLYQRKREEARISDALDRQRIVNVLIAQAATVPALPVLHLGWLLIGGFFTAGIASIGVAYAVDRLDPSFRTPDELSRYLDVKVLASIPTSLPGMAERSEETP